MAGAEEDAAEGAGEQSQPALELLAPDGWRPDVNDVPLPASQSQMQFQVCCICRYVCQRAWRSLTKHPAPSKRSQAVLRVRLRLAEALPFLPVVKDVLQGGYV